LNQKTLLFAQAIQELEYVLPSEPHTGSYNSTHNSGRGHGHDIKSGFSCCSHLQGKINVATIHKIAKHIADMKQIFDKLLIKTPLGKL
jgi:hypothetical protein